MLPCVWTMRCCQLAKAKTDISSKAVQGIIPLDFAKAIRPLIIPTGGNGNGLSTTVNNRAGFKSFRAIVKMRAVFMNAGSNTFAYVLGYVAGNLLLVLDSAHRDIPEFLRILHPPGIALGIANHFQNSAFHTLWNEWRDSHISSGQIPFISPYQQETHFMGMVATAIIVVDKVPESFIIRF